MSSEHKRPLYAFAIVALACAFFVGTGLKSEAFTSLFRASQVSQQIAAGVVHIAGVPADVIRSHTSPRKDPTQAPRPESSDTVADQPRSGLEQPAVVPAVTKSKAPGAKAGGTGPGGKKASGQAGPGARADTRDQRSDSTPRRSTHPGQGKTKGQQGEGPRSKSRGHDRGTWSHGAHPRSSAGADRGERRGHRSHHRGERGADRGHARWGSESKSHRSHGKSDRKRDGKGHAKGHGKGHKGGHKKGKKRG